MGTMVNVSRTFLICPRRSRSLPPNADGAPVGTCWVLRHPRHLSAGQVFWSHHEKLCVVDQRVAFLGGMDLCEGRFDDDAHRLRDDGDRQTWPGPEYYQPNAPRNESRPASPLDDDDAESAPGADQCPGNPFNFTST